MAGHMVIYCRFQNQPKWTVIGESFPPIQRTKSAGTHIQRMNHFQLAKLSHLFAQAISITEWKKNVKENAGISLGVVRPTLRIRAQDHKNSKCCRPERIKSSPSMPLLRGRKLT